MDRAIEKKRFSRKRILLFLSIAFAVVMLSVLIVHSNNIHTQLDLKKIKTGVVEYGDFQEIILITGNAEPISSVLVDAKEGGTVLEILKEEGAVVQAGEPLLLLRNETVMLDYMQRESQIVEQINNLRNTRISLYQNQRRTEDQLVDLSNQLVLATRTYKIDSSLVKSGSIAEQTYFESKNNYIYLKQKVGMQERRIQEDLKYQKLQISRIDASINMMERNLGIIKQKLENMVIAAPQSGQLNSFNLEIGQVLTRNQSIARIDNTENYILQANIDQHYLGRIKEDQTASIKSGNRTYEMRVSKVFPTVNQGQFQVSLMFTDSLPAGLKRGQNFQVFLEASAQKKSLMLPRGSFYQSSGGQFVYVLDEEGKSAVKRSIQLGTQNPDYYEVISGLEEGEEVIISNYAQYKDESKITLKE